MANTNEPFRRLGPNSWEELLNKVNEILQDPPSGCEPIDEIEIPEECHRWAKDDIQEVQDKMNEMPGECFEFDPIPDLWKKSIIDNIEAQLENAWCDCDDEDCLTECKNASDNDIEIFLETLCVDDTQCVQLSECSNQAGFDTRAANQIEWDTERDIYNGQKGSFSDNFKKACYCQAELKKLEDELKKLEDELEDLTDPDDITAKEDEISDKEAEISDKEVECNEFINERDAAKQLYLEAGQRMNDIYFESASAHCNKRIGLGILLEGLNYPPSDVECYNKQPEGGGDPITGIGAECFEDISGPFRCDVKWKIEERGYDTTRRRCDSINSENTLRDTGFLPGLFGEFDIDGNPIILSWVLRQGCPSPLLYAYCLDSNCDNFNCGGGFKSPCHAPNSTRCRDYRALISFEDTREDFDCDGGPCGDEESG